MTNFRWFLHHFLLAKMLSNTQMSHSGVLKVILVILAISSFLLLTADGYDPCFKGVGFYPDERNCTRFYQCLDAGAHSNCTYIIKRFRCPSGMVFVGTRYPCSPPLIRFPPEDCFSLNDQAVLNSEDNMISDPSPPFKTENNNKTSHLDYNEDLIVLDMEIPATISSPSLDNDGIIIESEEFSNINSTAVTADPPVTNSTRKYFVIFRRLYNCPNPGRFPFRLSCWFFIRCYQVFPRTLQGFLLPCPFFSVYSPEIGKCISGAVLRSCPGISPNSIKRRKINHLKKGWPSNAKYLSTK